MKNNFKIVISLIFFLLVGCAADTHVSLSKEMLDNMENLIVVLEGVKDSSSCQEAIVRIKEITQLGKNIQQRIDELGEPSESMLKELEEKYASRGQKAAENLRSVLSGLIESDFGMDIMKALNN